MMSKTTLLERLRSGDVVAVPEKTISRNTGTRAESRDLPIPESAWDHVDWNDDVWRNNTLVIKVRDRMSGQEMRTRHFDVRFESSSIDAITKGVVPANAATVVAPLVQAQNKGGAPPKAWWEGFWIEMCRAIYEGRIRPDMSQADIQKVMHQWVSDQNHEAGETVIEDAAKKLLAGLKK